MGSTSASDLLVSPPRLRKIMSSSGGRNQINSAHSSATPAVVLRSSSSVRAFALYPRSFVQTRLKWTSHTMNLLEYLRAWIFLELWIGHRPGWGCISIAKWVYYFVVVTTFDFVQPGMTKWGRVMMKLQIAKLHSIRPEANKSKVIIAT